MTDPWRIAAIVVIALWALDVVCEKLRRFRP